GVGVDLEIHLDVVEAVAHVAVDAEDALDVHRPLERRLDRAQLDLAQLRDRRHAGGQAAGQAGEHHLHRRRPLVLGGEDLGVVGVEGELGLVALLLAQAVEALDAGLAVGAVQPLATRLPVELRGLGRLAQRIARAQQRIDVDSVLNLLLRFRAHRSLLEWVDQRPSLWRARLANARNPALSVALSYCFNRSAAYGQ